jgi:phenylalanyl-tRNA synthetase alpha chain
MNSDRQSFCDAFDQDLRKVTDLAQLESLRVGYIGKQGHLTSKMKQLGQLDADSRKQAGAELNEIKEYIIRALDEAKRHHEALQLEARLALEHIDITIPGRPSLLTQTGGIHPLRQANETIMAILGGQMGFVMAEGPDIETGYHNFTALNIAEHHPARQMHDTFYLPPEQLGEERLLRTHTSPVQIRAMQAGKPPFRIMAPGRTYRADSDMTHSPMFHQIEGLVIEESIHMGHLKHCLLTFLKSFFESDAVRIRLRPSFFPFTEPSAEVDIGCRREGGRLMIGEGDDWLEVLGCGMVHPNVLRNVGLDPEIHQGFAFGLGLERLAMLKYGISDLRTFYEPMIGWMRHYHFSPFDVPSLMSGFTR